MKPESIIEIISGMPVPDGDLFGEKFTLHPFQREFIEAVFGDSSIREAGLSMARGGGKTGLAAAICAAVLLSPRPREILLIASSFKQASIAFRAIKGMLVDSLVDRRKWKVRDSGNAREIERIDGTRLTALGSDPRRLHGAKPDLVLCDEGAYWPANQSDAMFSALRTSLGKRADSKLIAIGTQPVGDHWFSRLLRAEPGTGRYARLYAGRKDADPADLDNLKAANPGLEYGLPRLDVLLQEAEDAKKDDAILASFRALRLNTGTSEINRLSLIDPELWIQNEIPPESPLKREGICCWGVDLGGGNAQSAIAAFWPSTGRLECFSMFPTQPDLEERARRDCCGNLYSECFRRGELLTRGGLTVPITELLEEAVMRWGYPDSIAADSYKEKELKDALDEASIPLCDFSPRGMGYKHGGEDISRFRDAVMRGEVSPVKSLLLRSAFSEAVVQLDEAGHEKVAKSTEGQRRRTAKDDAAVACLLAVAEGRRRVAEVGVPVRDKEFQVRVASRGMFF